MEPAAVCRYYLVILIALFGGTSSLDVTILHTNDVHTRFEQTDAYAGECTKDLDTTGLCYGGVARRMTKIKKIRDSEENVVLLDAGDAYHGTIWFYVYRGMATAHFMNLLKYDAMAIGDYEFVLGIDGLTPFLNNITFPALSCNIDSVNEPSFQGLYVCSNVLTLPGGDQIGLVGYTLESTPDNVQTGNLVFKPELGEDLQQSVDDLIAAGINKIIALGHAGIKVDKAVATSIRGIDVVVGGHSNTFLYTGTPPSNEEPYGEYPLVLSHEDDDTPVLVVSSYAYGKYLGRLDVTFDEDGVVTKYGGNPILLDKNVEQDADTFKELMKWKVEVDRVANEIVGNTFTRLNGDNSVCGTQECNMGNFLADAMVFNELLSLSTSDWTQTPIAMTTATSIRSSVDSGPIITDQLARIMPYGDTIDKVQLKGEHLWEVLEASVESYDEGPSGMFLQVSGLIIAYDVTRPPGDRVLSAMVRCSDCNTPSYEPLDIERTYTILMNSYQANGRGGYGMIKEYIISREYGELDIDVTINYLRSISYIMTGEEGRQVVYTASNPTLCYSKAGSLNPQKFVVILLNVMVFIKLFSF